jgi:hypothetical protein
MRGGRLPGRGGYSLVEATAEVTGLSEDEVIAALEDGQTVAEIAEAEQGDPQAIVDVVLAEHEDRLQEAVDAGRLTDERMTEILEEMEEQLTDQLEEVHEPRLFGPGDFGSNLGGGILGRLGEGFWTMYDAVADALGLTPAALFTELHDGKTVAEIAEEQGVELEAIQDATEAAGVEARKQAIEQAVEAGRLTQEQADWMIEGLEQGFSRGRGFSPDGGGFRPERGGHGGGMGW